MYEFFLKLDLKCNTYSANLALLKSVILAIQNPRHVMVQTYLVIIMVTDKIIKQINN